MEERKRTTVESNTNEHYNKRFKLEKSCFEDLANELVYEIFDYLDIYHVYQSFLNLNKRFQYLLINSNLPIQIHLSTISKSTFDYYYKTIILPNKHRINSFHLSNPFIIDMIFSPPRLLSKFHRLERLILDNIKATYFDRILIHLRTLPRLYSLTINPIDYIPNSTVFFILLFKLPKLKYCQIKFESKLHVESLSFLPNHLSSIEYLVIKNHFQLNSFYNLLLYLPNLRYLSIDCLDGSHAYELDAIPPVLLPNFKSIALKLNLINFHIFEKLVQTTFSSIENLRLTTKYDPTYLDAKRWEYLIQTSIPNLKIFDFNHDGYIRNHSLTYHGLINQFTSSFWINKQWFFTHQHDWKQSLDSGIFHSTEPYRRRDYKFYWELDEHLCQHIQETNLRSVRHVIIGNNKATNNHNNVNYFPNAIQLTIKYYFQTTDDLIITTLKRLVNLSQIEKLNIHCQNFPFEQLILLIFFLPNLHRFKLDSIYFCESNLESIQTTNLFHCLSLSNEIKHLEVNQCCSFEQIQMIIQLFPKLEYLKIEIDRKQLKDTIKYLLTLVNLVFLCLSSIRQICLKEIKKFIKLEKLLEKYFIKFINNQIFLWW